MFRRVYLDNSATTQVDPRVLEEMLPYFTEKFGNPSSIHYFGQDARTAVDKARHQAAALINSRPNEVIFSSGGTESNNLAIKGLLETNRPNGGHIITSSIEHPSVKNVFESLELKGWTVTYLPVYDNGVVKVIDIENEISEDTVLISVMSANNEIGTIQPIEEIGRLVRSQRENGQKIWFHTDAVQAVGKITVDVEAIGCDLLSFSAHKIHAPKGSGALFIRRGVRISPQNIGGHQERERRGGTESVPNIVGFGKACEIAAAELTEHHSSVKKLRDELENGIFETIEGARLNGDKDARLPNISNISFSSAEGEALLINLDMQGIAVSTGSACSSGTLEPSPVIRALSDDEDRARCAIRFSLGRFNTTDDIVRTIQALPRSVENLRRLSPDHH